MTSAFSSVTTPLTQSPLSPTHSQEGKGQLSGGKSDRQAADASSTQQKAENSSSTVSPSQLKLKIVSLLPEEAGFIGLVGFPSRTFQQGILAPCFVLFFRVTLTQLHLKHTNVFNLNESPGEGEQ